MKRTVASIKASRIPSAVGICSTDPRLLLWLNAAREQLINRAVQGWFGQTVKAQFCYDNGCITWPREVGVVVAAALCKRPIPIRNGFWEFIENLNHIENCDSCACGCRCSGLELRHDETTVPVNSPIRGTGKTIRSYPSDASDVGKKIIYQGYDKNGIWVRTLVSGVYIDGEQVTLALPYVDTATQWLAGGPTGVIKDLTNYRVLVYEHDTVGGGDRPIAVYQPDETLPEYRRSILPGLVATECVDECATSCCTGDGCNGLPQLTAIVKLAYTPVSADNDWVYPSNLIALEYAMRARKRDEDNDDIGAETYLRKALRELQMELRANTGDIQHVYVDINRSASFNKISAGFI